MEPVPSEEENSDLLRVLELWESLRGVGVLQVVRLAVPADALPAGVGDQVIDAALIDDSGTTF